MPGHPCNSLCFFNSISSPLHLPLSKIPLPTSPSPNLPKFPLSKTPIFPAPRTIPPKTTFFTSYSPFHSKAHIPFSSLEDRIDGTSKTQVSVKPESSNSKETELELLGKPSPIPIDTSTEDEVSEPQKPEIDEALAPFLKFFKARDSSEEEEKEVKEENKLGAAGDAENEGEMDSEKMVTVEYYEPKPGDLVAGVVVSGNENKLDVNVGADLLGTMLTKEVLPLYDKELSSLLCDLEKDAEDFMVAGKIGIVKDEEALRSGDSVSGRPVVEVGTVLFAEVLDGR